MSGGALVLEGTARIGVRALFPPLRLELRPAEWTTLLGPSGAGKSTLLRLIAGLPGPAMLDGRIEGRRPAALMAQDVGLLPWLTVAQNISLGARLRGTRPDRARVDEILARTGLRCVAAPISISGTVVAALSCSAPTSRLTDEALPTFVAATTRRAQMIASEFERKGLNGVT